MILRPKLSIIRSLLFTYSIENFDNANRERFIASKNINNEKELSELFEKLTKPEFILYSLEQRQWHIDTLKYFLSTEENFDSTFEHFDTYFDDDIVDKRALMRTLLTCLNEYHKEEILKLNTN